MFVPQEFIDVIIMTLGVGYIFMDLFKRPMEHYDPLYRPGFSWDDLRFACMVTGPAIILHELGHKMVAIMLGLQAQFHAAYQWLAFGVFLKLIGSGFIFFVPGYVSIQGIGPGLHSALTAFAGPAVNLILYLVAMQVLRSKKSRTMKQNYFWILTKKINGFLFLFNMIPFFFFDGAKVVSGLYYYFFV